MSETKPTREQVLSKLSELSCPYRHVRMTDCPHCAKEVESLVQVLTASPAEPPR